MQQEFLERKSTSEILFHEFMKCSQLMRFSFGHDRGFGSEFHREFGHNREDDLHHHNHNSEDRMPKGMLAKIGQARVLEFLLIKDGQTQKELADVLRVSTPTVNEHVAKLLDGGYIEKREHETDKRTTRIFLTEGGRFFAQKMEEGRTQISKDIFAPLSEDEQKQLLEFITKLNNHLGNREE